MVRETVPTWSDHVCPLKVKIRFFTGDYVCNLVRGTHSNFHRQNPIYVKWKCWISSREHESSLECLITCTRSSTASFGEACWLFSLGQKSHVRRCKGQHSARCRVIARDWWPLWGPVSNEHLFIKLVALNSDVCGESTCICCYGASHLQNRKKKGNKLSPLSDQNVFEMYFSNVLLSCCDHPIGNLYGYNKAIHLGGK